MHSVGGAIREAGRGMVAVGGRRTMLGCNPLEDAGRLRLGAIVFTLRGLLAHGVVGEMAGEFQALCFAAGQRRHGLAEAQVIQADIGERRQAHTHFGVGGKELERLRDGEVEYVGDALRREAGTRELNLEDFRPIAPAIAIGTAQVHIRQELHLDVLEAVAAAGGAAAVAGVETERAGGVLAFLGLRQFGEQVADGIEGADVAGGIRAGGAADAALIDHDDVIDEIGAVEGAVGAGVFGGFALGAQQGGIEHIVDQGGFAGAADAGDAHEALQRDLDVDGLEVVLGGAVEAQAPGRWALRGPAACRLARQGQFDALAAEQIVGGERALGAGEFRHRSVENDFAAVLARAGPDVEHAIRGLHHLRVVFDHHQRVAGIAQALHDADDAADVSRVQADGRLIQHEQRTDQGRAERGGEVDALYFAAGERARLAIEIEVAQAHVGEIFQARADFTQQQVGGIVERRGQCEGGEELQASVDREQHQLANIESGAARSPVADAPEQRVGLQAGAVAGAAFGVRAISREQHTNVHLVGFGLEPREEAFDAVPDIFGPFAVAVEHPGALGGVEIAPRGVDGNAALARESQQIGLALLVRLGLPWLDGAGAQR